MDYVIHNYYINNATGENIMLKRLYFNAKFSDIGWMPILVNTYRNDTAKAVGDYIKRMTDIGVKVLETSDAHFA